MNPTILVVEDNEITRRMFGVALRSQGWTVVEAEDGASALAAVARARPDVVVSDLTLPDMDGLSLLERMLALPGCRELPVVATSGFLSRLEQARSLPAGFVDCLFKPVDPMRLIEVVRACVSTLDLGPKARGQRVLLVDDDAVQLRLLKVQLERAGFAVSTAPGGVEALRLARERPPSVIVSDVLMPEMDGFRLCDAVRHDPVLAGVAVVLMSAEFSEEADRELARSLGASALVPRSPAHEAVIEAVLACLRTSPPTPRGDRPPDDAYSRRLLHRLERETGRNTQLEGRLALHEAAMSVLTRLGDTAGGGSTGAVLQDLLQSALDAAGISIGAVFLREPDGLAIGALHGVPGKADLARELAQLLARADAGSAVLHVPAGEEPEGLEREALRCVGARSLLLVPLRMGEERLGVLALGAARPRHEAEWLPFADAIGGQLAHAVALTRAMRQVASEQERFRQLADAMPQIVWSATPAGVVDYYNARWYEFAGAPRDAVGDARWAPFVHPDDLPVVKERWLASLATGEPLSVEHRLRARDGAFRWFLGRAVLGRDAQGSPVRWYGTTTDIDDQKRVQARLRESEERQREITENLSEVFWMTTPNMDAMLYISPAYERVWARSCASLIADPMSWAAAIHDDDRDGAARTAVDGQRSGVTFDHTYRIVRPDGGLRWIRDRGYPVRDARGEVVRYVGTAEDITQLKQAEAELQLLHGLTLEVSEADSPARALRIVLDALCGATGWSLGQAWLRQPDGTALVLADALGGAPAGLEPFVEASRRTRRGKGEGCIGRVWATRQSLWLRDLAGAREFLRADAAAAAGLYTGLFVPVLAGEEVVAVLEFFSRAPRDEDPRLLQLLTSVSTQLGGTLRRKITEEALRRTEAQLRQSQKMEAVGRLAGGVAHDFNNLLTAILGYSEMIGLRLDARDPLQKDIAQVVKAGQRAASLTRQLLVFSRNETIAPQVLEPNAVISDLEKLLHRLIGEDIELRVVAEPAVGRVKVDKGYLEQVIMNLCVNARDAMPRGGRLTLETANVHLDPASPMSRSVVAAPGAFVMIAVSDTGCGMTSEVLSHLFEPFYTTKEQGKGTGLGLATVWGIVAGADGHIAVYSEPGRGTSFKVYLPRVHTRDEPRALEGVTKDARGSETVLIVEDDEMVRALAQRFLEARGYQVLTAVNGGEALLLCEQHAAPIDLLLTDVVMPRLSGPDLVRRLEPLRPGLKVLFFSGYTSGAIQHAEALGSGRAFLQKPFTADALCRKVREVLDAGGEARAPISP